MYNKGMLTIWIIELFIDFRSISKLEQNFWTTFSTIDFIRKVELDFVIVI